MGEAKLATNLQGKAPLRVQHCRWQCTQSELGWVRTCTRHLDLHRKPKPHVRDFVTALSSESREVGSSRLVCCEGTLATCG